MSNDYASTLRFVNRNLQLTLLSGAVALAALMRAVDVSAVANLSFFDFAKLLVLLGLPIMLVLQWRSPAERILARGTATIISAVALAHTLLNLSNTTPLFLGLLFVVMAQVSLMRYFDHEQTHALK